MKRSRPLCPPLFWNGRLGLILLVMLTALSLIFALDALLVHTDVFNEPYERYLSVKLFNASAMEVESSVEHFQLQIKGLFFHGRLLFSPLLICVPLAIISVAAVLVVLFTVVLSDSTAVPDIETPEVPDLDPVNANPQDDSQPLYAKWWFWCIFVAVKIPILIVAFLCYSRRVKQGQHAENAGSCANESPFYPGIFASFDFISALFTDVKEGKKPTTQKVEKSCSPTANVPNG